MSTRAAAGDTEHAPIRLQPLLFAAGVAAVLPAVADAGAIITVFVLAGLAVVSVVLWATLRRTVMTSEQRARTGAWMAVTSVACFILVLLTDRAHDPEVYFLVAAALVCSLASMRARLLCWVLQVITVAGVAGALVIVARGALETAVSVGLLLLVAVLANLLAGELISARRSEMAARADAERRTELLEAVRDLPGSSSDAAIAATVRTLRSLAFDSARVGVLRNGQLQEVGDAGPGASQATVPRGEGLMWHAIEEDRTITSADNHRDDAHRELHSEIRSLVVAPIRVGGHPAGAVVGGRHEPGEPSAAEVEVAEVLAAHLGVVLDTETLVRRQRQLLERMAELDHMRSGFAREVSSELRDPLTIVRMVGEAMTRHADDIDPDRRRELLQQMCDHADELRQTIDALLDFSRFQASRRDAEVVPMPLVDLLAPVLHATGASSDPSLTDLRELGPTVESDAELVRHALEILLVTGVPDAGGTPGATVLIEDAGAREVRLSIVRHDGSVPPTLVRSLVSQLLVAGGAALAEGAAPVVLLRGLGGTQGKLA